MNADDATVSRGAHSALLVAVAILALCALGGMSGPADAAGPLIVNGAGEPLVWGSGAIPWNPDLGGLGAFDNIAAVQLVGASFDTWAAVPLAAVSFINAGALPVDVTPENVHTYVGVCGDGLSPIVFDADGSVTDYLLGRGASNVVLGFAGPECGGYTPPVITEASAVLNGKFIDGVFTSTNPEIPLEEFTAVFVHEFGHYLNLDHSQVNVSEAFDGNPTNDDAVATMFPILVNGVEELTLARDDEVSLAMLYPAPTLLGETGRITGRVLESDGVTPFQGAYVIARNVADPRRDAIGYASGARFFPSALGGPPDPALEGAYELAGLTAGADYTVEIEAVYPGFVGGSSVGPLNVPRALPGPSEFWSGDDEAEMSPPDDPSAPGVPLAIAAGETIDGVDVILNVAAPPANDACTAATAIATFPYEGIVATSAATGEPTDPPQGCARAGAAAIANSVWFDVAAPGDGTITVDTSGSGYDTIVSVHIGRCGRLADITCNDDAHGNATSEAVFAVSAGTHYLIQATAHGSGGRLHVSARFDPLGRGTCTATEPGSCIPGGGGRSTDCTAEWLAEPVPLPGAKRGVRFAPAPRLDCADGDPRCDFDGAADGRCRFHVAVCVNNRDPRLATRGCVATGLSGFDVVLSRAQRARDPIAVHNAETVVGLVAALAGPTAAIVASAARVDPPLLTADQCSPFAAVDVPLGSRLLRAKARATNGRVDTDTLRLRCVR